MPKNETKKQDLDTVLIRRNSNKAVVKKYSLSFENQFQAIEWGEKQAIEFGPGHYAELQAKKK